MIIFILPFLNLKVVLSVYIEKPGGEKLKTKIHSVSGEKKYILHIIFPPMSSTLM